ncbi:MAG: LA_0442/LA_0875 N-terminal domain-containing protein, partial [Leptonema sp. (in: bacteria)]
MIQKFIVAFLSFTFSLYADTIILNNGKKYEGKVINQTREKVQMRLENGKEILINKNEIQKILFGPTEEDRRKLEEEKKRLEEIKKKEEQQRKLEEEKRKAFLKKEPILKRKDLYLSFGTGQSNSYLPLESLQNIFYQGAFLFSVLRGDNSFFLLSGIHHTISNLQGEAIYNQNNWSFGLKL